jgi:putative transposase
MEGAKEYRTSWGKFLRHMKERGINGVRLFISDKSMGAGRYPVGFLP